MYCITLLLVVVFVGSSLTNMVQDKVASSGGVKSWDSAKNSNGVTGRSTSTVTLSTRYITGSLFVDPYNTLVPHGITLNKLLTYSVFVNSSNGYYPSNYNYSAGFNYHTYIDTSYVRINPMGTNGQNIYGQPFAIYMLYMN